MDNCEYVYRNKQSQSTSQDILRALHTNSFHNFEDILTSYLIRTASDIDKYINNKYKIL